ncbi:hypothetical protein PENSPDRAFT_590184 [Peniophora sp. CONT]|nr:hypothetical protein PENSPDRAFT_590184 [Peniophora sp. CONT]
MPDLAREALDGWALSHVEAIVEGEADNVTEKKILQPPSSDFNQALVLGFDFPDLPNLLQKHCPSTIRIMNAIATTDRQRKESSPRSMIHKRFIAAYNTATLFAERSRSNNYMAHVLSFYLYSQGATRQLFGVLNSLGQCMSYQTIAGRGGKSLADSDTESDSSDSDTDAEAERQKARRQKRRKQRGSLDKLSIGLRRLAQHIAAAQKLLIVYDNINMAWKVAEQIMGRTDEMQNGTCATITELWNASEDALSVSKLRESVQNASHLNVEDIELSTEEQKHYRTNMVHTVLRIMTRIGGEALKKFEKDVADCLPISAHKIAVHKTNVTPLAPMPIDESSKTGNAELVIAIFAYLRLNMANPQFSEIVKLIVGDQLSVARLRSVAETRVGNEGGATALEWAVFVPGLFHYKVAGTHGVMLTHLGSNNHDLTNPASLSAHNAALGRKPIVATSLPSFRTCKDLIDVSLYARVLQCALEVSGKDSLSAYAQGLTFDQLKSDAENIVGRFADGRKVHQLERARARKGTEHGDMVFESAVLFLRDALLLREFTDAIKSGDSGRVYLVLKVWALSYRGQGRTKYAQEALFLIHNVEHVWPAELRDLVFDNWLVNTTGKTDAFLEVDLLQEHLNYWIKNYYAAHGSNASWEWLKTIGPCVEILRQLASQVNATLGSKQGNKHAEADLTDDIDELMGNLAHNKVYQIQLGRVFAADDAPRVPDVMTKGYDALTWGASSPLSVFNAKFEALKKRRRIRPLVSGQATANDASAHEGATSIAAEPLVVAEDEGTEGTSSILVSSALS